MFYMHLYKGHLDSLGTFLVHTPLNFQNVSKKKNMHWPCKYVYEKYARQKVKVIHLCILKYSLQEKRSLQGPTICSIQIVNR